MVNATDNAITAVIVHPTGPITAKNTALNGFIPITKALKATFALNIIGTKKPNIPIAFETIKDTAPIVNKSTPNAPTESITLVMTLFIGSLRLLNQTVILVKLSTTDAIAGFS
ncbi:Uncharacterised protein [Clostridioides difficile]|nr:Uncharacterised protein [Clostridioides difficile]